jgi:hypothetical protein
MADDSCMTWNNVERKKERKKERFAWKELR